MSVRYVVAAVPLLLVIACGGDATEEGEGVNLSAVCNTDQSTLSDGATLTSVDSDVHLDSDNDYENVVFLLEYVTPDGEVVDQHESSFQSVSAGRTYSQRISLDANGVPDSVDFDDMACEASLTGVNVEDPPTDTGLPF